MEEANGRVGFEMVLRSVYLWGNFRTWEFLGSVDNLNLIHLSNATSVR